MASAVRHRPYGLLRFAVLALVCVYLLAPLIAVALGSVSPNRVLSANNDSVTLRWYRSMFAEQLLIEAVATSLLIGVLTASISVALGFGSARLVRSISQRAAFVLIVLIALPAALPGLVSGLSLHALFSAIGIDGTFVGVVTAHVLYASPVAFFLLHSAHNHLDPGQEACARNLGASEQQIALHVVLPQLRATCIGAAIICALISWDEFIIAWYVGGFIKTIPVVIFSKLGSTIDPTYYALGTLITLFSVGLIVAAAVVMRAHVRLAVERV